MNRSIRLVVVVLTLLVSGLLSTPASAQFGRNKVQYRTFDFQVLKTEHFDIYYYPSEQAGVEIAARLAERWNVRLERLFQHRLSGRQPLILYGSHVDFEQTNVIGGELGEGTGGVTESVRRRIVLPLSGPLADTDHVIGHELVHAFQFDMTLLPGNGPGQNGAQRLPLWFIEGMAEYLSIGPSDPNTSMWIRDAALREKLPAIKDLNDPRYFPYRWGQALWAYVGGRWGDAVVGRLLTAAAFDGVDAAFEEVLGLKTAQLSSDWHDAIIKTYAPVLTAAPEDVALGRVVIAGEELGRDLNIGPALSPDGKWLAFLSTRSMFAVDLYVAEASTGRVVKRLTSTATDAHFSSIQFIQSPGAWDHESRQLAVATVTSGRAALAIFDAQTGSVVREIPIPDVDEILGPTWAPDGHAIGFSGMHEGLTDLYVYDLTTNMLRRLTTDAYADLHPVWSPDGRRIAFTTDRFSSDLGTLAIGPYQLAVIDPDSGAITQIPAATGGKQINPQWAPDGQALYFISDRGGVSDVYRVTLGDVPDTAQITMLNTGVSGITGLSPALSVAADSGDIAFSVYEGGKYDIVLLEPNPPGATPRTLSVDAALLPPVDRKSSEVALLLGNPALGLPEPATYPVEPYHAKLTLDGVAQTAIGVGFSRFGTGVGGGLALSFSDQLNNHQLVTMVQLGSGFGGSFSAKDIGAQVAYLNRVHRWNWGLVGGQTPYLSGGYQSSLSRLPNGDIVQTDQLFKYRQTDRSAQGLVSYPFDRASRVELRGGVSSILFEQVVTTVSYSRLTGAIYDNSTVTTSLADPLTLGTAAGAYVFDTSVFGATSPVQGQRYRIEASPAFGTINYTGVLADFRRYVMPVSFYTLAVRGLHYGRYGSGAEDYRLYPLSVGYPGLVRGYDVYSIGGDECVANAVSSCPLFDSLFGSRMLVGNVEFRFPVLRPFGVTSHMYGPLPVEVALFADAGTAWNRGERPSLRGQARGAVTSAGVAFRANVMGLMIAEFDVVRPFQRPGRGWTFGFNLIPGW